MGQRTLSTSLQMLSNWFCMAGAGDPSQRDLHRLEKWPDRELVNVNQGKRKALPLAQNNSLQQHRLGQLAVKQL